MTSKNNSTALQCVCMCVLFAVLISFTNGQRVMAKGRRSSPGGCEEIQVAMCKGLVSYNRTKLPNKFGHTSQAEIYWALQPWWPFMDAGCSHNLRNFLCGLYLPRCMGDDAEPEYPCTETCKKAKVRCKKQMRHQGQKWAREFRCKGLQPKSSKKCIKPVRERKKDKFKQYMLCGINQLTMCQGLPFTQGSLPNMFLQGDVALIDKEMQQFQPLMDSGCSKKLRFFLCGAYMPFCVTAQHVEERAEGPQTIIQAFPNVPFVVPCRELCQEVYEQCSGEYEQRTHGLPWPGKLHCHRYPSYVDRYGQTEEGDEDDYDYDENDDDDEVVGEASGNKTKRTRKKGGTVPCTMAPYNYQGN